MNLKSIALLAALLGGFFVPVALRAQNYSGSIQSGQVYGNETAGQAKPHGASVTAILDRALGSTRGSIIERGASGWALIGPGSTAGLPFVSNGTGADPSYQVLGVVGGGTGGNTASGTLLDNITGFSGTGLINRTGAGAYSFVPFGSGAVNAAVKVIAAGTAALGTSAIASGACASVVTVAATNTATTDVIDAGFNADPTGTAGYTAPNMLTIIPYPTANNVNFKVCNNTASSITPGAVTLNWWVRR